MHSVRIPKVINQMITFLDYTGFWHRGDKPTAREIGIKFFYCIYYFLFPTSLMIGAIISETQEGAIFLLQASIGATVLNAKLWFLISKQRQIVDLLKRVCTFSIRYDEDLTFVNKKLKVFAIFVIVFFMMLLLAGSDLSIQPIFRSEKILFLQIWFPFDYNNSEIVFCIASLFEFTEMFVSDIIVFFSVFIWYMLLSCSLRYDVLGSELKNMGKCEIRGAKVPVNQRHFVFLRDLKAAIDSHLHIKGLIDELESFLSNIFALQLGTSSLCTCGSIYTMAFLVGFDDLSQVLVHIVIMFYFISEIFMITYFGNEIMLSSNRLSYSLFESDWIDQPQPTKKCVIVFGEYLKQPHELLIMKLYPLTLKTFTRILNSAYSMFNILKSFQT